MSTLNVANIQSLTTSAFPLVKNSAGTEIGRYVRAWVKFNGVGTASITNSFNVSSITDNGQGDFTLTFANAFSDANYAYTFGHDSPYNTGLTPFMHTIIDVHHHAPTTTHIRVGVYHPISSSHRSDPFRACIIIC